MNPPQENVRSFKVICTCEHGLHMRPIAQIQAELFPFAKRVFIEYNGEAENLRSISALMVLQIPQFGEFTVRAENVTDAEFETIKTSIMDAATMGVARLNELAGVVGGERF